MLVEFESKLKGTFEGWSPTTVYKLKNGTKWMLLSNKTTYKTLNSPRVEVWRDGDDYFMKIAHIDHMEQVRRVE